MPAETDRDRSLFRKGKSIDSIQILLLAIALAMDAFGVSLATGVTLKQVSFRQTFRLAWHFGLFQALMPIIGWSAGLTVKSLIASFDHWVAFVLLAFIGVRMIFSAFRQETDPRNAKDPTRGGMLVMLSLATSVDALAVGLSLSMLKISIWTPAAIIGITASLFTVTGVHLGRLVGQKSKLGNWAEAVGGAILIVIGAIILHEHGMY